MSTDNPPPVQMFELGSQPDMFVPSSCLTGVTVNPADGRADFVIVRLTGPAMDQRNYADIPESEYKGRADLVLDPHLAALIAAQFINAVGHLGEDELGVAIGMFHMELHKLMSIRDNRQKL